MSKIVEVYSARDAAEAHLLVALLAEQDIEGRVVGEPLAGGAGELPVGYTCAPRIWVLEEDAEKARQVMRDWEGRNSREEQHVSAWTCPRCDSDVDEGFAVCWNCEYEVPQTEGT